jgi:hypothetical protein
MERAQGWIDTVLAPAVAVCTLILCGYMYLVGIPVPDELKVGASAASGYVFRNFRGVSYGQSVTR